MEITVAAQTWVFLGAVLLGAGLGVVYDCFRISRLAFRLPSAIILAEDLAFFAICSLATFGYMMGSIAGQVRIFVLIGIGIGFILYILTIGELVMKVSEFIIDVIRRILTVLYRIFVRPVLWIWRKIEKLLRKIYQKAAVAGKKQTTRAKLALKRRRVLLYNLLKTKRPRLSRKRKTEEETEEGET